MKIMQVFSHVRAYVFFFFFRKDIWLYVYLILIALYAAAFMGAFVLLFLGLQDFIVGGEGVVQTDLPLPAMSAQQAINVGLALLGTSALASFAIVYTAARAAATFGVSIVLQFQERWDELTLAQRRQITGTAKFASNFARLIMISLTPLSVFVLGIVYIMNFNPLIGAAVLLVGVGAIFAFVPSEAISRRTEVFDFDPGMDAQELRVSHSKLLGHFVRSLDMFIARRFIAAFNVFVLFLALLIGFTIFGPEGLLSLFNEKAVVIIVLMRASIMSLTRVTICLKVANRKGPVMEDIIRIKRDGALPVADISAGAGNLNDDEDDI